MREGTVIADRYRVEQLLVRRGLHQVYLGVDLTHEAPVAIKLLTPSTAYYEHHDQVQRALRLGRELERASAGIVRPLDGGEAGDSLFLIMDYIPGAEDLDLSTGPVEERLRKLRRVALLLRELHALRVVHRDARPGNFLVGSSGRIHLTNFRLARSLDDRLDDGDIVRSILATATPYSYLAPELLARGPLDTGMDVYPLGVMLFQLLTGELPFQGTADDVIALHKEVRGGHIPMPLPTNVRPSVPPGFDEVVEWSMHVDPFQRFATVDEFLSALDEVAPDLRRGAGGGGGGGRSHPPQRQAPPPVPARPSERMHRLRDAGVTGGPEAPPAHTSRLERGPLEPAPVPQGAVPQGGGLTTGRLEKLLAATPEEQIDPRTRLLVDMRRTLPLVGGGVSLAMDSHEVKFVCFSAQEDISGTVALAYGVADPEGRFGRVEQRVTLDLASAQGTPSGLVNLLHAANTVNLYGAGLSCQFGEERLRLRRAVLLGPGAPLEADDLQRHVDLLLRIWPAAFAALRDVQEGAAWNESMAFLVRPEAPDPERLETLRDMLDREGYAVEQLEGGRLGIGLDADRVELACFAEQTLGTFLVRAWQAPKAEARALKKGKHAREVEALLEELNRKNLDAFYALAWDPKRGVIAQAPLAEAAFVPERLDLYLSLLRASRDEVFVSLGEGDAPAAKKSWLPWRR
ncbi:MAG: protein kinase [Planctomycetota bacterium]